MASYRLSPLDGRYYNYTKRLSSFFSEFALFKYRLYVEIEYLIKLLDELCIEYDCFKLRDIYNNFILKDYNIVKNHEKILKHDVKALEYYIRDKFIELNINCIEFIHFGLTSQDINNTALSLSIRDYIKLLYSINLKNIINKINYKIFNWKNEIMISRTNGQPAVPTSMGKEFKVFSYRLQQQYNILRQIKFYGKFGGASGNLNAHVLAYPNIDWIKFGKLFLNNIGLLRSEYTTQIDSYDSLAQLFDCVKRINTILIDLCRDIWLYISQEYIIQIKVAEEIGSSTMPHQVNSINFENAEGNLMLANALFEFFSRKLPISRLQRDLTDSTVSRNIGSAFGYTKIAYDNILSGLDKLKINSTKLQQDLDNNKLVLTEGIQTLMRKEGNINAYQDIKKAIDENKIDKILDKYNIKSYIGYSNRI